MEGVQPDTVLTFGPDGMTGHADHKPSAGGRPRPRGTWRRRAPCWPTRRTRPEWLAEFREPLDRLNVFMGAEPPCTPGDEQLVSYVLDGELLETKLDAIRSMTSQVEPLIAGLGEDFFRGAWSRSPSAAPERAAPVDRSCPTVVLCRAA